MTHPCRSPSSDLVPLRPLVTLSPQVVRLRPAPHCRTPVTAYSLKVKPEEHFLNWQQDPYGNFLARLVFPKPTRYFELEVDLVAEMTVINPFDFFLESDAFEYPFRYADWLSEELRPYLKTLPVGQRLQEFLDHVPRRAAGTVDFLVDLNRYVHEAVRYIIRLEPGVQTCDQTLHAGQRLVPGFGLAAGPGPAAPGAGGPVCFRLSDSTEAGREAAGGPGRNRPRLHRSARLDRSLPARRGLGGTRSDLRPVHRRRAPAAGGHAGPVLGGPGHRRRGSVRDGRSSSRCPSGGSTKIRGSPSRTPTSSGRRSPSWAAGWTTCCKRSDVRLTMGGEPTFVSIDDMEGAEWNMAALGANKRKLAGTLFRRLARRFAKGPLLHFGQGKWYPGESLPRWALGCYWRKDGQPIWHQPELIAEDDRDYGVGVGGGGSLHRPRLRSGCGLSREFILPAYEDAWYYLWKERRLPVNVDPLESQLDDPEERARLARVFEQGLGRVVGYALPLRPRLAAAGSRVGERPLVPATANRCSCFPAIRRWDSGCRWIRSPGSPPRMHRRSTRRTRWRPANRCRCIRAMPGPSKPCRTNSRRSRRRRRQRRSPARGRPPSSARKWPGGTGGDDIRDGSARDGLARRAATRRVGRGCRADGAVRRAARRAAVCVHAARGPSRGLPGPGRRGRRHGGRRRNSGDDRRLPAAVTTTACSI